MKSPAPARHSGGQQRGCLANYRVQTPLLRAMIVGRESSCCALVGNDRVYSHKLLRDFYNEGEK